jgi:toxin ParE1/3/4
MPGPAIRYHPEAAAELEEADEWFRSRDQQLAAKWRAAARTTIESIAESPTLWAPDRTGIREVLIRPFDYKIVYLVRLEAIEIVAIAHTSRRPGYWRKRLKRR